MNALGHYLSEIISSARSFLNPPERSTMPKTQYLETAAKLEQLQEGDRGHLLRRSIEPKYIMPEAVVLRLTECTLMDGKTGKIDPAAIKVAEHIELTLFHKEGEGRVAARIAEKSAHNFRIQGDMYIFRGSKRDAEECYEVAKMYDEKAETQYIRTYAELAAYRARKIKAASDPSLSVQEEDSCEGEQRAPYQCEAEEF